MPRYHIKGIMGSGKTYLCSRLSEIARTNSGNAIHCFDTDDFVTAAYHALVQEGKKVTHPSVISRAKALFREKIKGVPKSDTIVLVGIMFDMPGDCERYFIKMSRERIKEAYEMVNEREDPRPLRGRKGRCSV